MVTARRALRLLAQAVAVPLGLAASLGIIDLLRTLPGPGLALALPLRATGHADRASIVVVAGSSAVVFGLAALALDRPRPHPFRAPLLRAAALLGCALTLQAISLQLVRQASLGLDWSGALASPAPFVCALGAFMGCSAVAVAAVSSDRRRQPRPQERPVEGRPRAEPMAKIGR
jgi:hypothetical protein